MKSRLLVLGLALTFIISIPAFAHASPGAYCATSDDCGTGEQCVSNSCQVSVDSSLNGTNQGVNNSKQCPIPGQVWDPETTTCHYPADTTSNTPNVPDGGTCTNSNQCAGSNSQCSNQWNGQSTGICTAINDHVPSNGTGSSIPGNAGGSGTSGNSGSPSIIPGNAAGSGSGYATSPFASIGSGSTIQNLFVLALTYINNLFVPLLFAIAFAVFLFYVFKFFILGGSNPGETETGRKFVMYAVIGFVLMLSLWGIVTLVKNSLGFNTRNQPDYPTFKVNGS